MSNIAKKIAQIIAKADSTTNEVEAETFMAKAQKMMEDHGLSLLDLGRLDSDDPVGTDRNAAQLKTGGWQKIALAMLAKYYGCEVITHGNKKPWVSLVGRESGRITTQLMWPYVERQVYKLACVEVQEGRAPRRATARTAIGNALALRLSRMAREQSDRRATGIKGLNALVPVDVIELELQKEFPRAKAGSKRKVRTNEYGVAAANKVNVNRQTGRAPASRQIAK